MKKLIDLLLVAVMCLPLVACTNEEEIKALNEKIEKLEAQLNNQDSNNGSANTNTDIIGTWEGSVSGITVNFIFNEDGTGTCSTGSSSVSLKWKYSNEFASYVLCYSNGDMGCINHLETDENGKQYIKLSGAKLYRVDD